MSEVTVLVGDAAAMLSTLPAESVQTVVTSPPYFRLRSYNGGEAEIGTEQTPAEYVARLVAVFREVRRVLRTDGTVWLNLGDSYAGSWGNQGRREGRGTQRPINGPMLQNLEPYPDRASGTGSVPPCWGLKAKDLMLLPHRVAMALQHDGWWVRQDIVWSKPNAMPSSVRDRPTKSHEYIFLLSKSACYYYDQDAVREPHRDPARGRPAGPRGATLWSRLATPGRAQQGSGPDGVGQHPHGRNRRTVWTVSTCGYKGAHFGTFPPALIEPCILAGTSEKGCCPACGAPWRRVVEREKNERRDVEAERRLDADRTGRADGLLPGPNHLMDLTRTVGWEATCKHDLLPIPCTVLDPFAGSGTTGMVALDHGRHAVLVELNPDYVGLIEQRCRRSVTAREERPA